MSSIGTGYDLAASTFSPDGRIFQVEYAQKAVDNGGTVIGLAGKDGVVFAVEKLINSKLILPAANPRVLEVTEGIGMAIGGVYPDGKHLARFSREEAEEYFDDHHMQIPLQQLVRPVANYVHQYTLSILRPMAAAVMLSSYSESRGPSLWMVEPSGQSYQYKGWALGKHRQAAKTEIEKLKLPELSLEQLVKEAAKIIYTVRDEGKDKLWKLEMGWVGAATEGKFSVVPEETVMMAEEEAKQSLSDEESDEEMPAQ